jgi:O-acetylhomoserine/O-acetylserine sulfhydrylase-like pyridoxal-dependent enzyme
MNPFEAFQLLAGLETLSVRMERISSNALMLARALMVIEGVLKVKYLGKEIILNFSEQSLLT